MINDKIEWCLSQHRETNHFYDKYLPYEFHLRMVVEVFNSYKHLLKYQIMFETVELACWGHDLIEDTRVSYNDCVNKLGKVTADIIYAVTNNKGRNRAERANADYYKGIRDTRLATFVKLCDRIANVQYSRLTKSDMFKMYQKENVLFLENLQPDNDYAQLVDLLNALMNE